jgi:hypothetical protein
MFVFSGSEDVNRNKTRERENEREREIEMSELKRLPIVCGSGTMTSRTPNKML